MSSLLDNVDLDKRSSESMNIVLTLMLILLQMILSEVIYYLLCQQLGASSLSAHKTTRNPLQTALEKVKVGWGMEAPLKEVKVET